MADDKKNIPDAGNVGDPPKPGKVEPAKAVPPMQDQPAPAKAEAPKDKDAPAPSKEGTPPGKDEKQTTIPGMGEPTSAGKVVDFTAAQEGAAKGKPPEKTAAQDKGKQADKAKDAAKPRRGRPPKADKAAPDKAKPQPRDKMVCPPSSRQGNNLHLTHEISAYRPYRAGTGLYAASRQSWTSMGVRTPNPRWRRRKL